MAIPKTLRKIDVNKAETLIRKHTLAGTGAYEYPGECGDFVYQDGRGYWLIRNSFGTYETGKVSM